MLTHCIYGSSASDAMSRETLLDILAQSRANNATVDVTGMLLHVDHSFFQIVEGDDHAVATLMARIKADVRHTRITRIIDEPIARRSFPEWSMGFSSLHADQLEDVPGLNDFFGAGHSLLDLDQGRAKRL